MFKINCNKCGKSLADDANFCDRCGAATEASDDILGTSWENDVEENKVVCILAYLGVLFFIPLIFAPESQAGRFHANQGLVLFIVNVAGQMLFSGLSQASQALWFISWLFGFLSVLWGIFMFCFMLLGVHHVIKGERKPLPYIGSIRIIK